jgi:hypothetical protein
MLDARVMNLSMGSDNSREIDDEFKKNFSSELAFANTGDYVLVHRDVVSSG